MKTPRQVTSFVSKSPVRDALSVTDVTASAMSGLHTEKHRVV